MSYQPSLKRTWWLKNKAFKMYMLRELTVLPLLFFLLCLIAGMYALSQDVTAWQTWQLTMRKPLVIMANSFALLASLFHAFTFFQLFPRVMPLRLAGKPVPAQVLILGQWGGVVAVAVIFAYLFGG